MREGKLEWLCFLDNSSIGFDKSMYFVLNEEDMGISFVYGIF